MGNSRFYLSNGGFSEYLYETVGQPKVINGLRAKIVKLKTDIKGTHSSLPQYSNTTDIYFRLGQDGQPCQAKLYLSRRMCLDFDWDHEHKNSDGKVFKKGTVHVQVYSVNKDGTLSRRSDNARYMTDREIELYGDVLKAFNPNIKLRP